jgi:hypothetical protein
MSRSVRFALAALLCLLLVGCRTSEDKDTNSIGLSDGTPTGTIQSGYGDGKGDSIGGGGAAPASDANSTSAPHEEHK